MFFQRPPIGIDQRTLDPQGGIVGVSGRIFRGEIPAS